MFRILAFVYSHLIHLHHLEVTAYEVTFTGLSHFTSSLTCLASSSLSSSTGGDTLR